MRKMPTAKSSASLPSDEKTVGPNRPSKGASVGRPANPSRSARVKRTSDKPRGH